MVRDELSVLSAFLAVAEERSFTRAARRLGVSPSALSHAVRGLEEQIGVRLLARTTRSVAPTEAGAQFIARLGPALADVRGALDQVAGFRDRPAGRVRLLASRLSARTVLAPKVAAFSRAHPGIVLDVTTTVEGRFDLVEGGFDAGIHLGEFIARDMVAVRVTGPQRAAIVGAPAYLKGRPRPKSPRDLTAHRCLNFRHGSEGVYHWEFEKGRKSLAVSVNGPLVVDDVDVLIRAAIDGLGLAFTVEDHVHGELASGALVRVLEDWCPPFDGYFLYYPSRRQQPPALSALIEALRM
ncbi:MAG: LysR family transcriptional regulator [Vicinamibacterales bacterium]